jgi:predicted ATPase
LADVGLPEGIRQLIGRRLERLASRHGDFSRIAAVMGREFRLSDIEALVDVGEDAVLDAMDEALTASMVTEEAGVPGNFSFTHTLIREALYTSITAARRVRLHHRIASALEQQSSASEPRVAELAYHFGQAAVYKSAEKAVQYATRAGDHAATTLAFENAAQWYDMALRAMDCVGSTTDATAQRFDLHVKRGRSFFAGRTVGTGEERLRGGSESARSRGTGEEIRTARPPRGNRVLVDGRSSPPEVRR